MRVSYRAVKEQILDLAEQFFQEVRHYVPRGWLRTDLTMPQLKVLFTLFLDGPQSCSALADALALSLPTMTGILDRLEERRYLERQPDRSDRRRLMIALTDEGQQLVEGLWAAGREELAAVIDTVAGEELAAIQRALTILVDALRQSQAAEKRTVATNPDPLRRKR